MQSAHIVFTVKNVEDAHASLNTFVVKSRPVVRWLKILVYAKHTLVVVAGIGSSRLELGAGGMTTSTCHLL